MTYTLPTRAAPMPYPAAPSPAMMRNLVSPQRQKALKTSSTGVFFLAAGAAAVAALMAPDADAVFRSSAVYMAGGIGLMLWTEGQAGLRNLVRVDIFMILVLFLLTFFEFILPQDSINDRVTHGSAQTAVMAVLLGFSGIVLGRHAFAPQAWLPREIVLRPAPRITLALLCFCSFFGYLFMLLAVNFDIFEVIYQIQRPRFSQPWQRGRYGSISTLLNEFGLLRYLIPPLSAAILAQRQFYSLPAILFAATMLGFVLFEGFAGGTRNIFLVHVITFASTYSLLMRKLTLFRFILLMAPLMAISWIAIYYLPDIRTVGLKNFELADADRETLSVDMNLLNIARLSAIFPQYFGYLGFEIPYNALIRPIPRAVWPGKPEGLSISIEEALGAQGWTLSATFVGEMWMSGGYLAIFIAAVFFGAVASYWNRRGVAQTSTMGLIVFAIGLFPAGIAMRSMMSAMPAVLPAIFLVVALRIWGKRLS